MFHRAAWLVRDTRATGRSRLWSEIGAMLIDPVTGANRFISGDASRVSGKPADLVPPGVLGVAAAGALWRGPQTRAVDSAGEAFLEIDGLYGNTRAGSSRTPYDAFLVRMRFGGGAAVSEARVRGRLAGFPMSNGLHFSVVQSYDFQTNDAYSTGAQSFEGAFGWTKQLSGRSSMYLVGGGGLTVLGAVDSLPLGLTEVPEEEEHESDAGQGVSEGPRYYDYGPGSNVGGSAEFAWDQRPFLIVSYEGRHLYSLDGVRANHFLQRTRVDLLAQVRGSFGLGASGEYFVRHTQYQDAERTRAEYHYPQLRVYLMWRPR
jgi:hypothetical protein